MRRAMKPVTCRFAASALSSLGARQYQSHDLP
jgi:hypothetical protein